MRQTVGGSTRARTMSVSKSAQSGRSAVHHSWKVDAWDHARKGLDRDDPGLDRDDPGLDRDDPGLDRDDLRTRSRRPRTRSRRWRTRQTTGSSPKSKVNHFDFDYPLLGRTPA